jgi:hypothetical protein
MMTMDIYAGDTVLHSWEVLASILSSDNAVDILCDIGMYVRSYLPPSPIHVRVLVSYVCNATGR